MPFDPFELRASSEPNLMVSISTNPDTRILSPNIAHRTIFDHEHSESRHNTNRWVPTNSGWCYGSTTDETSLKLCLKTHTSTSHSERQRMGHKGNNFHSLCIQSTDVPSHLGAQHVPFPPVHRSSPIDSQHPHERDFSLVTFIFPPVSHFEFAFRDGSALTNTPTDKATENPRQLSPSPLETSSPNLLSQIAINDAHFQTDCLCSSPLPTYSHIDHHHTHSYPPHSIQSIAQTLHAWNGGGAFPSTLGSSHFSLVTPSRQMISYIQHAFGVWSLTSPGSTEVLNKVSNDQHKRDTHTSQRTTSHIASLSTNPSVLVETPFPTYPTHFETSDNEAIGITANGQSRKKSKGIGCNAPITNQSERSLGPGKPRQVSPVSTSTSSSGHGSQDGPKQLELLGKEPMLSTGSQVDGRNGRLTNDIPAPKLSFPSQITPTTSSSLPTNVPSDHYTSIPILYAFPAPEESFELQVSKYYQTTQLLHWEVSWGQGQNKMQTIHTGNGSDVFPLAPGGLHIPARSSSSWALFMVKVGAPIQPGLSPTLLPATLSYRFYRNAQHLISPTLQIGDRLLPSLPNQSVLAGSQFTDCPERLRLSDKEPMLTAGGQGYEHNRRSANDLPNRNLDPPKTIGAASTVEQRRFGQSAVHGYQLLYVPYGNARSNEQASFPTESRQDGLSRLPSSFTSLTALTLITPISIRPSSFHLSLNSIASAVFFKPVVSLSDYTTDPSPIAFQYHLPSECRLQAGTDEIRAVCGLLVVASRRIGQPVLPSLGAIGVQSIQITENMGKATTNAPSLLRFPVSLASDSSIKLLTTIAKQYGSYSQTTKRNLGLLMIEVGKQEGKAYVMKAQTLCIVIKVDSVGSHATHNGNQPLTSLFTSSSFPHSIPSAPRSQLLIPHSRFRPHNGLLPKYHWPIHYMGYIFGEPEGS
ncbi:hypothetical protein PQX77_002248 [Marasmius sp. AFHP31]|nr:hypothetical protein PQX77_002248 [Marasmius sp. AFHP31]